MSLESIPKFVWCSIASLIVSFTVLVCLFSYQVFESKRGGCAVSTTGFSISFEKQTKIIKNLQKIRSQHAELMHQAKHPCTTRAFTKTQRLQKIPCNTKELEQMQRLLDREKQELDNAKRNLQEWKDQ